MSYIIDFSKSPCPSADAIDAIKDWLGPKWDKISPIMAQIEDQAYFDLAAEFAGVRGFPVRAWYELYHGQGSWKEEA